MTRRHIDPETGAHHFPIVVKELSLSMLDVDATHTRVRLGETEVTLGSFGPIDGFDLEPECVGTGLRAVVAMPPTHYLLVLEPAQPSCELMDVTSGPYVLAWYDAEGAQIDERDLYLDGGDERFDVPDGALLGALRRTGR